MNDLSVEANSIQNFVRLAILRLNHLNGTDVLFILLAVFLPPLAVVLKVGLTSQFWLNVILTLLGFVPGQLHALWVVLLM